MPLKMLKRCEGLIMKNNIMVIGNRKERVEKEADLILKDTLAENLSAALENSQETVQEPVYDNDWGDEHSFLNKLDGQILADRKFYTRALYMQRIECNTLFDGVESEPSYLAEPLEFIIIDLSMGGIGIISEYEIMLGTILFFNLSLDNIEYKIKCKVVYCFQNSDKYRACLRIVGRDMKFIRHLKIFVARLSLQSKYGTRT
jgi:hypothetical protein